MVRGGVDDVPLNEVTDVLVFYETSQQEILLYWVRATVVSVHEHMFKYRRRSKGPPMEVAYKEIRLIRTGPLSEDLMGLNLDEDIANQGVQERPADQDNMQNSIQPLRVVPSFLTERVIGELDKVLGG